MDSDHAATRSLMTTLVEEAGKNEVILRRAQRRELRLLESKSLEDLFGNLVAGLKRSYDIEQVRVVLWDPDHEVRHLLLIDNPTQPLPEGIDFCESLSDVSSVYEEIQDPLLGEFLPELYSGLFAEDELPQSVAILPLYRNGQVIGSLNFGSKDKERFTSRHATDFLGHLAVIAAYCLENNINRSKLIWAGLTDVLTGWHNRRYLEARLPEEFALAARGGESVSFLLFDIDHFKKVNDLHGHEAGDMVLRVVSRRVQREIRLSDVAARWGGEEFIVVLPRTSLTDALPLAERIRQAVCSSPVRVNVDLALDITISVGASFSTPPKQHEGYDVLVREAIKNADKAMYAAKEGGRNQVRLAESQPG